MQTLLFQVIKFISIKNKKKIILIIQSLLLILSFSNNTYSYTNISKQNNWYGFKINTETTRHCYMTNRIESTNYTGIGRKDAYISIITSGKNNNLIFRYISGYDYQQESRSILKIGINIFELQTSGDQAWAMNTEENAVIMKLLEQNDKIIIVSHNQQNKQIIDHFNLTGFNKVLYDLKNKCVNN